MIIIKFEKEKSNIIPMNGMESDSFAIIVEAPKDYKHLGKLLVYRNVTACEYPYQIVGNTSHIHTNSAADFKVRPVDVEITVKE